MRQQRQGRGISAVKAAATPVVVACPLPSAAASTPAAAVIAASTCRTPSLPADHHLSITICNSHQTLKTSAISDLAGKQCTQRYKHRLEYTAAHHINPIMDICNQVSFFAVWNQWAILVRRRRHHPDHHLLHPLHHAQDEGSGRQNLFAGENSEKGDVRDFEWSNATKHNMN